nr:hypothetical protein [Candidatus Sigynarchaeota archaeon]
MESDYLKFFQSYIAQMIDIGGMNFPRIVSTKLGRNLGDIYKNRNVCESDALKEMFKAMGGVTTDVKDVPGGIEVTTQFPRDFCSIGGGLKPRRHSLIFEGICSPYATGFLSAFRPGKSIKVTCLNCITKDQGNTCKIKAEFT